MRREGSAFEHTLFSVAKQTCTETTDVFSCANVLLRCPLVLGYRNLLLRWASNKLIREEMELIEVNLR